MTDVGWLPASLYPVAFRIARADDCAYEMARLAGQWSFDDPLGLVQYVWDGRYSVRVESIRPVPPRIALLFSEAVSHLRAALDNVVWYLVEQLQGPPPKKVEKQVALPICEDDKAFSTWCSDRVKKGLEAVGAGSTLRSRARSLQPFAPSQSTIPSVNPLLARMTQTKVEEAHPLKLLQAYSNADKHRAIRSAVARQTTFTAGEPVFGPGRAFKDLQVGDLFNEGTWGVPSMKETSPAVMIRRPHPFAAAISPANEVDRICAWVADTAVPVLVTGAAQAPGLPRTVDVADSGLTERERLDAGGMSPASERAAVWLAERFVEADQRPVTFPRIVEAPNPANLRA